ncbi:hypothetical protein SLEP1_g2186 [Rubroshorea leprosula]|uniref:Uncharacterized protein n=1 Tax=Rubroshorea leprosula TaxID=152421 RepID=A0AAV5HQ21_9ROSI|nr:hypothetical protein SLEP1_g2186 [Rubroshorea leprosula]
MGEVGTEMELVMVEEEEEEKMDGSSEVVRWERFLPRMVLRVLLVEADDSTRQIITALLRKCSYKVAAVPDGLMAWETLKGRPHNIDLILTEVELPSISGFALLTLVMEHDICKNIPVIMMSSQYSISMVLKCMLKGAADFLIKPVRRNELRNLWQHVWRRHMLAGGGAPQSLPGLQHKVEATAENNTESNHSSDYASSSQKNKEGSKGSGTQSSCTTPYLEAESTYMQNMQDLSQMKCASINSGNAAIEQQKNGIKLDEKSLMPENQTKEGTFYELFVSEKSNRSGAEVARCNEASKPDAFKVDEDRPVAKVVPQAQHKSIGRESSRGIPNVTVSTHCRNEEPYEPLTRAIDLIGSFDNGPKGTELFRSNDSRSRSEIAPQLELSLRRSSERHALNHSDASAFSWYNNGKTIQPLFATLTSNCTGLKEGANKSPEQLSSNLLEKPMDTPQAHAAVGQCGQSKLLFSSPQFGVVPVPGAKLDNGCDGYGHGFTPVDHTQSGSPPSMSPKLGGRQDPSSFPVSTSVHSNPDIHDSEQGYHQSDETANCAIDQSVYELKNQESVGEPRSSSPAAGQSACSSLCNGAMNHESSSAYGGVSSRSDASCHDKVTAIEGVNGSNIYVHDGVSKGMDSHRSSQREAALTKFRLKRKDRCFEKKVRYQSRKRLAEQRPRVRGQFVRQVQNDTL